MSIVPTSITNFNRNDRELEIFWLFSMFVAGKNSDFAASKVRALLDLLPVGVLPITFLNEHCDIEFLLRAARVGQYGRLTKAIKESGKLNLRTASLTELMDVHGIGGKTARFFILHSRKDCKLAALDTHILKFLRANGHPTAPKSTPTEKDYWKWEQKFLTICDIKFPGIPIAEVDLKIWTEYSGRA